MKKVRENTSLLMVLPSHVFVYNQTRSQKGNPPGKPTEWGKLGRDKNVRLAQHYTTVQAALALCPVKCVPSELWVRVPHSSQALEYA